MTSRPGDDTPQENPARKQGTPGARLSVPRSRVGLRWNVARRCPYKRQQRCELLESRTVLSGSGLVLSELAAAEQRALQDFDDDRSDWIELQNTSHESLDLSGYHLSDNPTQPRKWTFPPGVSLEAGGHLVVFASGKDTVLGSGELHTNFRLGRDGETVRLYQPGGATLASQLAFPAQLDDISYGLAPVSREVELVSANNPSAILPDGATHWRVELPFDVTHADALDELWLELLYRGGIVIGLGDVELTRRQTDEGAYREERIPLAAGSGLIDFNAVTDATFAVDLADGTYQVTATLGDLSVARDEMALELEGVEVARLATAAGQFVTRTDEVSVVDGQLSVRLADLGGATARAVINRLSIDGGSLGEPLEFDFGSDASPLVGGAERVTPETVYSPGRGYGWVAGDIRVPTFPPIPPSPLESGENLLWIEATGSLSDFLADVRLVASEPGVNTDRAGFFARPTPGRSNDEWRSQVAPLVDVSRGGGTFLTDFLLELSSNLPGGVIHYTLNGSLPGYGSPIYDPLIPVPVTKSMQVRAFAAAPGYLAGPIVTHSFVKLAADLEDFSSPLPIMVLDTFVGGAGGDMDRDGDVDYDDLSSFVLGLNDPALYQVRYNVPVELEGDINRDGRFDGDDVGSLITILAQGRHEGRFEEQEFRNSFWSVFEPAAAGVRASLLNEPDMQTRSAARIRGTSSAGNPKMPLRLEARDDWDRDFDVSPLGLPSDSDWILNAQYNLDRSLLRNSFMYALSNEMGRYAVRTRFVELFANTGDGLLSHGDYMGIYVLMETVKRGDERVDVEKLSSQYTTDPLITGGYLLKIDDPGPGEQGFLAAGRRLLFVDPSEDEIEQPGRESQIAYLEDHFTRLGQSLSDRDPDNGYAAWIDVPGWIDHHLLSVLSKNVDALWRSTYLFKPRGGPVSFGPIWDFDRAVGSRGGSGFRAPQGWEPPDRQVFTAPWWNDLFSDPDFRQRYVDRYHEFRSGEWSNDNIQAIVTRLADQLTEEAVVRNFARWPVTGIGTGLEIWRAEIDEMRQWLDERLAWIDSQLPPQPVIRPETSSAVSLNGSSTEGIPVRLSLPDGTPEGAEIYYTLDGSDPRVSVWNDPSGGDAGGISPSAIRYDGMPLTVPPGTRVQARTFVAGTGYQFAEPSQSIYWSGPVEFQVPDNLPPLERRTLPATDLLISELMARNETTLFDEDGDASDWLEIHNRSLNAVSLAGWSLTDEAGNPTKWPLPDLTLAGGSYLVVFASGKNRMSPDRPLHANFKLDGDGEYLALVDPDMVVVHEFSPAFPPLPVDVSFGLSAGTSSTGLMAQPTPGLPNDDTIHEGVAGAVTSNVSRGYFSEPFEVELATDTPGAEIRFTTDGSQPTPSTGSVYEAPIRVEHTTLLRYAAFREGYLPGPVATQTLIFPQDVLQQSGDFGRDAAGLPAYAGWGHAGGDWDVDPEIVGHASASDRLAESDLTSVPSVMLTLPWEDMFGSERGIYIRGDGDERVASIEWIEPDGRQFQQNGSVQIQGGSSAVRWKTDKLSLRVKFQSHLADGTPTEGPDKLEYRLYEDSPIERYDNLILDAVLNGSWTVSNDGERAGAKFIQDQYIADLHNALGGSSPYGRYAHLYINGLYWGMYYVHDRPDHAWAAELFGGDKDEYHAIKHWSHGVLNDGNGESATESYLAMIAAAEAVRDNPDSLDAWDELNRRLDVDDFIAYLLANWYGGNSDWPQKNWYATATAGGQWRFHSWDAEISVRASMPVGRSPSDIHALLAANPEYLIRMADQVQKHLFEGGVLTPTRAAEIWHRRMQEVDRAIVGESARWGDNRSEQPRTRSDWLQVVGETGILTEFFPQRTASLLEKLSSFGLFPTVDSARIKQPNVQVGRGLRVEITAPQGTIYYTLDGSDPRQPGGEVASSARSYEESLLLTGPATVKTRVLHEGQWSALTERGPLDGTPVASGGGVESEILISEIVPRGASPEGDRVELLNRSSSAIDVGGWYLSDDADNLLKHVIPAAMVIPPGERIVLDEQMLSRAGGPRFALNGTQGEALWLTAVDAVSGRPDRIVDRVTFDAAARNAALGRWPDDEPRSPMFLLQRPTLGANNAPPVDSMVVLSEVYYDPRSVSAIAENFDGAWWFGLETALGDWRVNDGRLHVVPGQVGADTVAVVGSSGAIPVDLEIAADIRFPAETPWNQNAAIVFDYRGPTDFKYASIHAGNSRWRIGQRDASGWQILAEARFAVSTESDLPIALKLQGSVATLQVGGQPRVQYDFGGPFGSGRVGLGSKGGEAFFDNVRIEPIDDVQGYEFIEITSVADAAVDLAGWRLTGAVEWVFPAGERLDPGESLVVVSFDPADIAQAERFFARFGGAGTGRLVGPYEGRLANQGESLRLLAPIAADVPAEGRVLVDQIDYSDTRPWPRAAAGGGASLTRKSAERVGYDAASWAAAQPTPGQAVFAESGDMNLDGQFDSDDLIDLVMALRDQESYRQSHGVSSSVAGDADGDGDLDYDDLAFLIARLR